MEAFGICANGANDRRVRRTRRSASDPLELGMSEPSRKRSGEVLSRVKADARLAGQGMVDHDPEPAVVRIFDPDLNGPDSPRAPRTAPAL
jgi:hypothetical protein